MGKGNKETENIKQEWREYVEKKKAEGETFFAYQTYIEYRNYKGKTKEDLVEMEPNSSKQHPYNVDKKRKEFKNFIRMGLEVWQWKYGFHPYLSFNSFLFLYATEEEKRQRKEALKNRKKKAWEKRYKGKYSWALYSAYTTFCSRMEFNIEAIKNRTEEELEKKLYKKIEKTFDKMRNNDYNANSLRQMKMRTKRQQNYINYLFTKYEKKYNKSGSE